MPRAATGYRSLLRTPGAAAFFFAAAAGRVGIAMTGLGLVWLLHARTGSYGTAGLAAGGFALAEALIGPQLARLIDRLGQTRVLPFCLLAHGAAIAGALTSTTRQRRSPPRPAPVRLFPSSVPCPGPAGRTCCAASGPVSCPPPSRLLALLNLAIGLFFGTMGVSVSSFATGHGVPGAAAAITGAAGLSGLLSGWVYGLRRHRAPARRQLVVASAYLTGAALLLPVAPSAIWLGAAVVVTEVAIPPTLVLLNVLTEKAVHPAALTQAFTWNNSASAAGSAVAASLAGRIADAWGASAALAQAPAAGLVLLVLALVLFLRR